MEDSFGLDFKKAEERHPWPQKGDILFKPAPDWWNNARVNFLHDHWETYVDGYKRAGDVLVEHVKNMRSDQDTLVYPIVFLYRHYIELRLKIIFMDGKQFVEDKKEFPAHHDIVNLWGECKKIIVKVFVDDPIKDLNAVEKCIKEFAKIDPSSESFRYPINKQGYPTLSALSHINLRNLSEVISRIASFLDFVSRGISIYLEQKREIESEY